MRGAGLSLPARALAAEFTGTFALVFVGCGAIMVNAITGELGHAGVSLAFGLVIAAMIYAVGHVSGAHFNPAVTIALAATRRFHARHMLPYVGAQIAGASTAAAGLRLLLGPVAGLGSTQPSQWVSAPGAAIVEIGFTFLLVYVIVGVTSPRAHPVAAGAAIGATVALAALVGGPLTGASLNPARSIGPALASLEPAALAILPLYILAPVAGGLAGALAHGRLPRRPTPGDAPKGVPA